MSRTLALIPARGGSKGLPRKNVLDFAGKPLIAWSILSGLKADPEMRVVVSTDSDEIAAIARECGAEVPFVRPGELSTDEASSVDVALHALGALDEDFESILFLQPTSPLRTSGDINRAFEISDHHTAAVVSVCEATDHPFLCYSEAADGTMRPFCTDRGGDLRRQALPKAYVPNGAIYLLPVKMLQAEHSFLPRSFRQLVMPPERSIDIDSLQDFKRAEAQVQLV